jgi:hypothetical protein
METGGKFVSKNEFKTQIKVYEEELRKENLEIQVLDG